MQCYYEFMTSLAYNIEPEGFTHISSEVLVHRRWDYDTLITFGYGGRFFQYVLTQGLTEGQAEDPDPKGDLQVQCPEVFPHVVQVTEYRLTP